jgi:hypothetical protein
MSFKEIAHKLSNNIVEQPDSRLQQAAQKRFGNDPDAEFVFIAHGGWVNCSDGTSYTVVKDSNESYVFKPYGFTNLDGSFSLAIDTSGLTGNVFEGTTHEGKNR